MADKILGEAARQVETKAMAVSATLRRFEMFRRTPEQEPKLYARLMKISKLYARLMKISKQLDKALKDMETKE